MTTTRLAVPQYSPMHFNGVHGPRADKTVKDLINAVHMRAHSHTHTGRN